MPYINIKTNVNLEDTQKEKIKSLFGSLISLFPGKSEEWLMIGFDDELSNLYFKGSSLPCGIIDVSIYGPLPSNELLETFTSKATKIIEDIANIAKDRIYIKYSSVRDWGWNGSNF